MLNQQKTGFKQPKHQMRAPKTDAFDWPFSRFCAEIIFQCLNPSSHGVRGEVTTSVRWRAGSGGKMGVSFWSNMCRTVPSAVHIPGTNRLKICRNVLGLLIGYNMLQTWLWDDLQILIVMMKGPPFMVEAKRMTRQSLQPPGCWSFPEFVGQEQGGGSAVNH